MSKGVKNDAGKIRYDLVPVEVHEGLADVITYGANKYSPDNWRHVDPKRYEAAMLRHFNAYRKGEILDDESGKNHLFHAMACLAFLYEHTRLGTARGNAMECLVDKKKCSKTKCDCKQLPGSGITENDLDNMSIEFGGWDADSHCCLTGLRRETNSNEKSLSEKEVERINRRIDDGK